MSEHPLPFPSAVSDEPMVEPVDERRTGHGRRATDATLAEHVAAADTGISLLWKWAQIITTIICAGFTLGVFYMQSRSTERAITELRSDVKDALRFYTALDKQVDRNTQAITAREKELERLQREVERLRGDVNTMRDMREAYVYNSASKQGKISAVPP